MADTLIDKLKAKLDEIERIARACNATDWRLPESTHIVDRDVDGWQGVPDDSRIFSVYDDREAEAIHAINNDPASVLRQVAADRKLINEILAYEAKIDGEWGCCHSADQIGKGQCPDTKPSEITALLALAEGYDIEVPAVAQ